MILHRVAARCQFHIGEIQKATYYTAEANVTKYGGLPQHIGSFKRRPMRERLILFDLESMFVS
jgi:hypothetical protein